MPAVCDTTTLSQPHATLQLCSNKLKSLFRSLLDTPPGSPAAPSLLAEMHRFRPWLEQWEAAFSAFLATAMPALSTPDVRRARVLKANHLSTLVLASVRGVRDVDFEPFGADFRAIVGLAAAILDGDREASGTPEGSPRVEMREVGVLGGEAMTLADPLRVVASCATDAGVRGRGARLLQRIS